MMSGGASRYLLHAFSTFKLGGPQARFVQLANAFGPSFHHIILAMDGCYEASDRLDKRVSWETYPLDVLRGGALANRPAFRDILTALRPDMLLTYNWGSIEWAAANLPKIVQHVHVEDGFGPDEARGQLPRRVWLRRALLALPRVPVVVASRNLERIARRQWWVNDSRVRFIANGVAIPDSPNSERRAWSGDRPLVIGTVAGLRPEKNIGRLIRAFAGLRAQYEARLVIVGDGPERQRLMELAHSLGVAEEVEFAGYLTNPIERLQAFDVFALSSDTEQLPISLLEAMACGVPVIATRVGDVADIIPEEAAVCISEANDISFAETLLGVIQSRGAWHGWVAAGRQRVMRDYTERQMLDAWKMLFEGHGDQVFGRRFLPQRDSSTSEQHRSVAE